MFLKISISIYSSLNPGKDCITVYSKILSNTTAIYLLAYCYNSLKYRDRIHTVLEEDIMMDITVSAFVFHCTGLHGWKHECHCIILQNDKPYNSTSRGVRYISSAIISSFVVLTMCDLTLSSVNVTSTECMHYVKSRLVLTNMIQSIKIHLEW